MRKETKSWLLAAGALSFSTMMAAGHAGAAMHREGTTLSGQVVDAVSHEVLDSVHVSVKGTTLQASTSSDGSFLLEKVVGEKVALIISRTRYKTREVDIEAGKTEARWTVALWPAR